MLKRWRGEGGMINRNIDLYPKGNGIEIIGSHNNLSKVER